MVVEHDSKEIFTPIAKLRNLILLFSAAIMALVMTIGVLINRSIATPVKILSKAVAAIGRGDLDTEVTVKTKDEIGQFAQALNTMVSDLSKITTSRDVLNQEIERRAQTEKELLLAQALSEEQLSELQEAQDASLNMFEDIDDENIKRKRAEEELKRQKANLDALFNASPFGMLLVDENGRIKRINSVAAGLVAKDAASVVNSKPGSGLGCIHSMEDVKGCGHGGFCSECPMRKAIEKVLDSGETVRGSEFEATFLVNGAEVDLWLEISAEPMNLEGSRHVIMAITNITDRKAREKELREVHEDLVLASNRAGMAEVATDVIHNVGNVLNSVNISTTMIREIISNSKVPNLKKVTGIIQEHAEDIGQFLSEDPQGKHIPAYLGKLAELLTDEQAKIGKELLGLSENVEHIKETIKMQQSYSKVAGVDMASSLGEVVENAIQINDPGLEKYGVTFVRESAELPKVSIDKQRVLQILVNLIGNAKHAVADNQEGDKVVTVRFYRHGEDRLHIQVADNGVGIPKGKLSKIFGHGFTTKENGHGFGLHSGALAAKEMGGSLTVESDGPGLGATFTLEIPFRPVRVKV